jgi:HAD superfamily hydrolase (TIGR01450 family)
MDSVRAVLIDIDGVLTVSWEPLPGAVEAVQALRAADLPFALVTNTTSRTRSRIAETLSDVGFPVGSDDVLGAPAATAAHLREHHPGAACLLLSSGDVVDDLDGVQLVGPDDEVDVVVIGGAGPEFSYAALDRVYRHLQDRAALIAMHRNLYWRTDAGLQLDAGAFLLGLEAASGTEAGGGRQAVGGVLRGGAGHTRGRGRRGGDGGRRPRGRRPRRPASRDPRRAGAHREVRGEGRARRRE